MPEAAEPIPAATIVVMREGAGAPELLFAERSAALRFAGGALVFPGGRVDPEDVALAARLPGDPEETAARIAAIRETIEEAGLPIGLDIAADAIPAARAALHAGAPFADLLDRFGATLQFDALTPFARWLPRGLHQRVFDTRFYLAAAPADAPEPEADGGENVRVFWSSAQRVLDAADEGRATIIFPTRRNLERLAQFASYADALADAVSHPIRVVTPWIEERDGAEHLCIPDDLGYPVTAEPLDRVRRT